MTEPLATVNGEPVDPDKARQWGEQWRTKHSRRWVNDGGAGFFPRHQPAPSTPLGRNHSRDVILALERQINGGQQLSEVRP